MESDELVPISALQHWLFCPRQCALIHVERLWEENRLTAEGRLLHERVHDPGHETRGTRTALRSLPIASLRLGIAGVADVVELHGAQRRPYPIEYKRGRPTAHRADEVQLCAQAICLEEMFLQGVAEGALFYGEPRRRTTVLFDAELRALTERVAAEVRVSINAGNVPAPIYQRRRCDSCSLKEVCRPKRLERPPRIDRWLARMVDAGSAEPP